MVRILVTAGSTRRGSWNKKVAAAAAGFAREAGAEASLVDLADFAMPLYDGDLEESSGLPENAKRWKRLLAEHDGWLISCPEYNHSISGVLKNAIDWASRREGDEGPVAAFRGHVAGLASASPGGFGGMRGLVHVRAILSGIGVHVIPEQLAIPAVNKVMAEDGTFIDKGVAGKLRELVQALVHTTRLLRGSGTAHK